MSVLLQNASSRPRNNEILTQQVTESFACAKFHVRVRPAFTRWPTHQTSHVGGADIRRSIDAHSMQVAPQPSKGGTLDHMIESTEQQTIDELAQRLVSVYPDADPTDVARLVNEEYARFAGRPIRDFIPLFVERNAKAELSKPG